MLLLVARVWFDFVMIAMVARGLSVSSAPVGSTTLVKGCQTNHSVHLFVLNVRITKLFQITLQVKYT
jgi:hypothetical protein